MKYKLVLILLIFLALKGFSQDIIIMTDGIELKGKITELGPAKIKYSVSKDSIFEVSELDKSDVFMILFESGRREILTNENTFRIPNQQQDLTGQRLQRSGNRIYVNGKFHKPKDLKIIMGLDLYTEYMKTRASIYGSSAIILGSVGILVFSGVTSIIASAIYSSELNRFQYYYLQGHKWPSGNDYSLGANMDNLKISSDVLKVSESLCITSVACLTFGIVFKINSYKRMDKVINFYNSDR